MDRRTGEHWVNSLHECRQEVPFIFQWDRCRACTVVHCNLKRLGQRPQRFDISLDAQVTEDHDQGSQKSTTEKCTSPKGRDSRNGKVVPMLYL